MYIANGDEYKNPMIVTRYLPGLTWISAIALAASALAPIAARAASASINASSSISADTSSIPADKNLPGWTIMRPSPDDSSPARVAAADVAANPPAAATTYPAAQAASVALAAPVAAPVTATVPSSALVTGPGAKASPPGASAGTAGAGHANQIQAAAEPLFLRMPDDQLARLTPLQRNRYRVAAAEFPAFCHDWERLLHEREVNNLQNIRWQVSNGYKTASYVGYGKVVRCETKESAEGVPIGKVFYEELKYDLFGKTLEEARHARPRLDGTTTTLEIFSWEKDRWFY